MRDVVIIGGGLTGLSAAHQLTQHELDCTLIEVKQHLGGSIGSVKQAECILDSGAFAITDNLDKSWLQQLGLQDALFPLNEDAVAFKNGTASLISALQQNITATRLMRMAVSSIGELDNTGKFSICLENGLMFDAKALILAVPARYVGRMFYGYINPITETLLDYQYDTIYRVSIVCKTDALPPSIPHPPDMAYCFIHQTDHPSRVPEGYTLLQFGLRMKPSQVQSHAQLVDFLRVRFGLPQPLTYHVGYWAEDDPISCYENQHHERIQSIREHLPDGIMLVGSDYSLQPPAQRGINDLNDRIQQGIQAAQQAVTHLK